MNTLIDSAEMRDVPEVEQTRPQLPPILDSAIFAATPITQPAELVHGILHQGSKLALGGGSKAYKTWNLTDLAFSVAHSEPWLGFKTSPGRVLYLNFELPPWSFQSRINAIAQAKHREIKSGVLDVWNLRGYTTGYTILFPQIEARICGAGYSLLILDPAYKVGQGEENSPRDIADLLNAIERLTVSTGAAVAFGAHFSKGNQAAKESIDRISGSGVFARDPDTIITFTKHEVEDAFTVETTLRNFKPIEPFVVRWLYPLMRRDDNLDPSRLKKAKGGRPSKHTAEKLLEVLGTRKLKTSAWQDRAAKEKGIPRSTFYDLKEKLTAAGAVTQDNKDRWTRTEEGSPKSP